MGEKRRGVGFDVVLPCVRPALPDIRWKAVLELVDRRYGPRFNIMAWCDSERTATTSRRDFAAPARTKPTRLILDFSSSSSYQVLFILFYSSYAS